MRPRQQIKDTLAHLIDGTTLRRRQDLEVTLRIVVAKQAEENSKVCTTDVEYLALVNGDRPTASILTQFDKWWRQVLFRLKWAKKYTTPSTQEYKAGGAKLTQHTISKSPWGNSLAGIKRDWFAIDPLKRPGDEKQIAEQLNRGALNNSGARSHFLDATEYATRAMAFHNPYPSILKDFDEWFKQARLRAEAKTAKAV